ncbi:MAG: AmmeMemoRadiSam system protein A, partial [Alphaproteobacteria bacterium]|nr:AmmeMemoRadiSam system protein A [Alphaproteobacteria bacterium]
VLSGIELEQSHLQNFANHNKDNLLQIVDLSLKNAVLHHEKYHPKRRKLRDVMFDKGASFVTLTKNGNLRGCIGSVVPSKGIAIDIADNTYAAALYDARFAPVTADELDDIDFTVSLLTNFEPVDFSSYEDLLTKIIPGTDGLLIEDGERSGLFLPAVWKLIPDPHNFLTELKVKAGLMPSYWSDTLKIFRFRTVEIKNDND